MPGTNIRDILGGQGLSGTIVGTNSLIGTENVPPALLRPSGKVIMGNTCQMVRVHGSRQTAQLVAYGSPSKRRTTKSLETVAVTLAHFKESLSLPTDMLQNLVDPDGNKQRLGEFELERQVQETKDILQNTRVASVMSAFSLGAVYYDSDGNLLPSSSGAQVSVSMSIPSGNINQLAIDGGSAVIDKAWSAASTKIVQQLVNFKSRARKQNNYTPKIAMYGSSVIDYFLQNDQTYGLIKNNARLNEGFASGVIPSPFLGFEWFPAYDYHFEDQNGSIQSLFPASQVTFFPEVDLSWYELLEGTTAIPGSMGSAEPNGTLASVVANQINQKGMFGYAYQTVDPVGATMVYGDTHLPFIKVPKSVYIATVAGF